MSRLRVGVFPADQGGCGHYRLTWPWLEVARQFPDEIEVLHADDMQERVLIAWDGGPFTGEPTEYHTPKHIVEMPDIDVAVFQRPLHSKYAPYFKLLRERGIVVIVDLDDNFDRIDTRNVAWCAAEPHWLAPPEAQQLADMFGHVDITKKSVQSGHVFTPAHKGATHKRNIRTALKHADLLITSTPSLAQHYGGAAAQTIVIPNYVHQWYVDMGEKHEENDPLIVGWTGSVSTHPNDLQRMGHALPALRKKDVLFSFKVVGTGVGVTRCTGLEPDITSAGWVSLHGDYQREYAEMDIALCPLEDSSFNVAKSWLKPLEAAALGVIPVMSSLVEYERIHAHGVGLIAKRPREWEGHVRQLLQSEEMRREMRARGLEAARELTLEKNAYRWVEALNSAMVGRMAHAAE